MARKATANSVSRLLGSNIHFRRSTSYSSPIRGVRNWSAGFSVTKDWQQPNSVRVSHNGSFTSNREVLKKRLKQYAEYLEPHYNVVNHETHLIVTQKPEKNCHACAYSGREPDDPRLVCGHAQSGLLGLYVTDGRGNEKPPSHCGKSRKLFKQHPGRNPDGSLKKGKTDG